MAPEPAACLALPPQSGQFRPALFRTLGYAETIYVTDDNWLSPTGPFARNPLKTHLTFRSAINGDGRDVPPGTVLQAPNFTGGILQASDLGAQLFAYVGNTSNPTFLCAIDNTAEQWFVPNPNACAETCVWASDGDCDDGGPGSEYTGSCSLGTDCTDCGPRNLYGTYGGSLEPPTNPRGRLQRLSPEAL